MRQHPPAFIMPHDWLESKLPMLTTMMLSTFLCHLFSLIVWNLCTSYPADALIEKMRVIYEATSHDFYNAAPRTRSRDAHILVTALSVALALLETRAWACQGKRMKAKASRRLRPFAPHVREMLLRRGPLPSHACVLILVQFILYQFRVLLQCPSLRGQHDIYNLSLGKFNYVGRSQTLRKDLYGEVDWSTAYVSISLHYEVINLEL